MSSVCASKRISTGIAALSLLALAACESSSPLTSAPANASLGKGVPAPAPAAPPSQYVVLFNDGATDFANPAASGVQLGKLQNLAGAVYGYVADPAALRADPNVKAVLENTLSYTSDAYPTGALYFQRGWQWNMQQIRADQVPSSVQGLGTRACIIDTGIDETHQDLAGKVVASTSFVDQAHGYPGPGLSPSALDSAGHGTHVAGTVTTNGIGVAGVAPAAKLMSAKVFAATGGGSLAAIFDAMAWCTANNADVISMSLGGKRTKPFDASSMADRDAYIALVDAARSAGTVVVAAAGNDNVSLDPSAPYEYWPAQIPGVITVGASAATANPYFNFPFPSPAPSAVFDNKAGYSQFGPDIDIWAPGGTGFINRPEAGITSTCSSFRLGGGCAGGKYYWSIQGTSMATPHVSGGVVLVTSRSSLPRGLARTQAVEACLLSSGDPVTLSGTPTRPRLNALKAATDACSGL